jgi:hypothetical protein
MIDAENNGMREWDRYSTLSLPISDVPQNFLALFVPGKKELLWVRKHSLFLDTQDEPYWS